MNLRLFSFSFILGSVLLSSLCFANAQEKAVVDLEVHKIQLFNSLEEHLKIVRSDMPLDDIKAMMKNRLEEVQGEFKRDLPHLELDVKFVEALDKINTIESKDQLILEASNMIDDLNSAKDVIVGGLTWHLGKAIVNKGGAAWFASPLIVVALALDVAFIWVEAPVQVYVLAK